MKLYFYGADKEVTGSCHCLETGGKQILIDCGLQQGQEEKEKNELPFDPAAIDVVLVTHAHVDHSGRLPLLVKHGFQGNIISTSKTCDLLKIMLLDSAHIQESDAQWKAKRNKREGKQAPDPLYTITDAQNTLKLLTPCEYGCVVPVCDGVEATFTDAGHLLGSASITVDVNEAGIKRKLVFSGDVGNLNQPIIRDPQYLHDADYIVVESTYGNRLHKAQDDLVGQLADLFDQTFANGGTVVIPAFAVGRTQELLYCIREIKERHLVKNCPMFPVYVDSPLAYEATKIYDGDLFGYADEETVELIQNGFDPISFHNLMLCRTVEESMALNQDLEPKVILSASGMCDAGRIRHHLKHNLWHPESAIVFVGYQAKGTLGRRLLERPAFVKLFGEKIAVRAQIYNFKHLSGHADQDGLLRWMGEFNNKPQKVFVVHGEENAAQTLARELDMRGFDTCVPDYTMEYDLLQNQVLAPGVDVARLRKPSVKKQRADEAFLQLVEAGNQLITSIQQSEGMANKDLLKYAKQLKSLVESWEAGKKGKQ